MSSDCRQVTGGLGLPPHTWNTGCFLVHCIIYYCQIFGRMLSGLISMKVINPPLSPVKIEQHFFLKGMANYRS